MAHSNGALSLKQQENSVRICTAACLCFAHDLRYNLLACQDTGMCPHRKLRYRPSVCKIPNNAIQHGCHQHCSMPTSNAVLTAGRLAAMSAACSSSPLPALMEKADTKVNNSLQDGELLPEVSCQLAKSCPRLQITCRGHSREYEHFGTQRQNMHHKVS